MNGKKGCEQIIIAERPPKMLKTTLKIAALSVASLTLLSACGAGGLLDNLNTALANANAEYARSHNLTDGSRVVSTPINDGSDDISGPGISVSKVFIPDSSNNGVIDTTGQETQSFLVVSRSQSKPDSGDVNRSIQETFAVRRSGDNIILTVNGVEHTLSYNNDFAGYADYAEGTPASAITGVATLSGGTHIRAIEELLDGIDKLTEETDEFARTFNIIYGTYLAYRVDLRDNSNNSDGFATVGIPTPASFINSETAVANYDAGSIDLHVLQSNSASIYADGNNTYRGQAFIEVNFDEKTISGTAPVFDTSGDGMTAGTLTFNQTQINAGAVGFMGSVTLDSDLRTHAGIIGNPTGQYAGSFFGPTAENLAGVIHMNGRNENGALIIQGGFSGTWIGK